MTDYTEIRAQTNSIFENVVTRCIIICSGKSFPGGKTRVAERPERLLARLRTASLEESSGPRVVALRAPRGPDGTRGFRPRRTVAGNYILSIAMFNWVNRFKRFIESRNILLR